ncbi:MAG TPA: hypothetical protein VH796_00295 [Nitrososphaeraceae archaeon]
MKRDEKLDPTIIQCLTNNRKLHYNALYREVCSTYRKVSPDTFSSHVKRLVDTENIERTWNGIGREAQYFLTNKARRQLRMGTLDFKSDKEKVNSGLNNEGLRRQKLYILLLLFRHRSVYKFDTEAGFDNFLSQFRLTRQQLIQTQHPKSIYVSGDRTYDYLNTSWESHSNNIRITRQDVIHRIDSTGKPHRVTQPEFYYYCTVKGLTARDIVHSDWRRKLSSFKVTKEQTKEAFSILRKENLIKPIAVYNDEEIYEVSDERLEEFLQDCCELYEFISDLVTGVWDSIRSPKREEIKWLEFFIGKEGTELIRNRAYERKKTRHGKTKDEFSKWLKW